MKENVDVVAAIHGAIDDMNKQLPVAKRLTKNPAAPISAADLDSLNMINFLLAVEERLRLDSNLEIDLGAAVSSSGEVPFENVADLVNYIRQNSKSDASL
jgi:acyl carrier protein